MFTAILEANGILKKYGDKQISFRITFGNITSERGIEEEIGESHPLNVTLGKICPV